MNNQVFYLKVWEKERHAKSKVNKEKKKVKIWVEIDGIDNRNWKAKNKTKSYLKGQQNWQPFPGMTTKKEEPKKY